MYFLLEGFDFGVGMLLPFVPRTDEEAEYGCCGRSDRSGTGTRSGSSSQAARRSRHSRPGTRRCSRASTSRSSSSSFFLIVRVVSFEWRSKSETPRLAVDVDVGEHDRQLRRVAALGHRAVVPRLRRPDRLGRRLHGRPLGSLQPVQRVRRNRGRRALRLPRRDVPDAAHARVSCVDRAEAARRLAHPGGGPGRGLPRLDGRSRDGSQRQGPVPAGAAGRRRDRRARARRVLRAHGRATARAFAMTALATIAFVATLFTSLYPRVHGLEHRTSKTASPSTALRPVALRAHGDERRRADLRSARAALPGLDVLRLPPPARRRGPSPRSARHRARPRSASPPPCARGAAAARGRRGTRRRHGAARARAGRAARAGRRPCVRRRVARGCHDAAGRSLARSSSLARSPPGDSRSRDAGRPQTSISQLRLDLVETRLRRQPAALDGVAERGGRDGGSVRRGRARDDLRALPAAGRPRPRRAGRCARARRVDRPSRGGRDAADAAARPRVHVARRAVHGTPRAGALAGAGAALGPLPRRRARAADAPSLQPRARADASASSR